ncbi:hypothetical protein O0L34_g17415 [Tuta absoluta]|nr:hypothetical protein O0L34_g17415 [Tuta absoluta]
MYRCSAGCEVSLAKPPSDKKKKEEILRARERRMMQMIHGRGGCSPVHGSLRGRTPQPAPRPPQARGDYDYDYDYYGYGDYRGGYNEPFYRYDEFYFDYAGPPQPSAVRQPPNRAQPDDELGVGPNSLYYDLTGGIQGAGSCGTGGRWARRAAAAAGPRGGARRAARGRRTPSAMRGNQRAKPSLPGKRKFDGGHQNQGGESKRRLGAAAAAAAGWGDTPAGALAQPLPPALS